ncbi:MAG TPA: hypothetical protein VF785_25685 [Gemmatimonadaceae bacterium]
MRNLVATTQPRVGPTKHRMGMSLVSAMSWLAVGSNPANIRR